MAGAWTAASIAGGGGGGGGFFRQPTPGSDDIFWDGTLTLGNQAAATSNAYPLSIVRSADRTIEHAQISVQNTRASQLRLGFVGPACNTPAVLNTAPGTALEVHASRGQDYFASVYHRTYIDNDGVWQCNVPLEVPRYTTPADMIVGN